MIIEHPLLGPRDAAEFVYLGDASLIDRPDRDDEHAAEKFYDYQYVRTNPVGRLRELWYHEQGDRSWLVVTRDTVTHEITKVELARDAGSRCGAFAMTQPNRINGGLVDRGSKLEFSFNGRQFTGHPGDTLASALLANGQKLVGRSFKYHRPRGIFSAGSEEPNALVQLRAGSSCEPNTRATTVELFDGLQAESQNHRLSLEFDLMAVNDLLSPFLSAGFYYKTFMWPKAFWERLYEPLIRASAGLGKLSMLSDPDCYDKGFLHCDLLVVGAGPAGLSAALAAGRAGARVIIADEDFLPGGRLNFESSTSAESRAAIGRRRRRRSWTAWTM